MRPDALAHYRCPACAASAPLGLRTGFRELNGEIVEGMLECRQGGHSYAIADAIPRFVAPSNYASSFGFQWNRHRLTQLDSYTGLPVSRLRLTSVTGWPARMEGQLVLEAGSGAGRFTEILAGSGATLFSFDYSSAVEANFGNNGSARNLNLAQADIFNMPFAPATFDKVVCLGVLQHTPDPKAAFFSLASRVRTGGELAIDVYARKLTSLLHWKYLLRPITTRMDTMALYNWISWLVPPLIPPASLLRRALGPFGSRLLPILEYSHLGLPKPINEQWAILDTFDMYSPVHDHPQSVRTVREWFAAAGFDDVVVGYGPNGVIGRGRRTSPAGPAYDATTRCAPLSG